MQFTSNPIRDLSYGYDRRGRVNSITGPNGTIKRQGTDWSENDQMMYDLYLAGLDYDYQAQLLNYQNEYNSPENQARLMRQAGINPDLQNIQMHPSASNGGSIPNTQFGLGEGFQKAMQGANLGSTLLTQALEVGNFVMNHFDYLQRQDANELNIGKLANEIAGKVYSEQDFTHDYLTDQHDKNTGNVTVVRYDNPFTKSAYNSRNRKRLANAFDLLMSNNHDKVTRGAKQLKDLADTRTGLNTTTGNVNYSERDEVMKKAIKVVTDAEQQAKKALHRKNKATDNNLAEQQEYFSKSKFYDFGTGELVPYNEGVARTSLYGSMNQNYQNNWMLDNRDILYGQQYWQAYADMVKNIIESKSNRLLNSDSYIDQGAGLVTKILGNLVGVSQ